MYKAGCDQSLPQEEKDCIVGQKFDGIIAYLRGLEDKVSNEATSLLATQAGELGARAGRLANQVAGNSIVHAVERAQPGPESAMFQRRHRKIHNVSTHLGLSRLRKQLRRKQKMLKEMKEDLEEKVELAGKTLMEARILKEIVEQREAAELENERIDDRVQTKKRKAHVLHAEAQAEGKRKKSRYEMTISQQPVRRQPIIESADEDAEEDIDLFEDDDDDAMDVD